MASASDGFSKSFWENWSREDWCFLLPTSVSFCLPLICSTSPVDRFSATAPSLVIFWTTFARAFRWSMAVHLPFRKGIRHRTAPVRFWKCSGKWDTPGAGRRHCPGFSDAAPGSPCASSCGGFPPALWPRGYVRPSEGEAHEPFHPIRVQGRVRAGVGGQVVHRRRQAQAPDGPAPVPLAEDPALRQKHIQVSGVPVGCRIGGKGRGKHQPRG